MIQENPAPILHRGQISNLSYSRTSQQLSLDTLAICPTAARSARTFSMTEAHELKTAEPATITVAPACTTLAMVVALTPPSTSIST